MTEKIDLADLPAMHFRNLQVVADIVAQIDGPPCCTDPGCAPDRLADALTDWAHNLTTNAAELRAYAEARRTVMREAGS